MSLTSTESVLCTYMSKYTRIDTCTYMSTYMNGYVHVYEYIYEQILGGISD